MWNLKSSLRFCFDYEVSRTSGHIWLAFPFLGYIFDICWGCGGGIGIIGIVFPMYCLHKYKYIGGLREKGEFPRTRKDCWRNFINRFSKKSIKIEFFYWIFKFQIFQIICVFGPNARTGNAWFVNSFYHMPKSCSFGNFLKRLFEKLRNFSQSFQKSVFFVQTRKKFNALFAKFFEKYAKIMHFCNFLRKFFWKFSEKLLRLKPLQILMINSRKILKFLEKAANVSLKFIKKSKFLPRSCNFPINFLDLFENSSGVRRLPPPDPLRIDTPYKPALAVDIDFLWKKSSWPNWIIKGIFRFC